MTREQTNVPHYFLITQHKTKRIRHISVFVYPKEEIDRRLRTKGSRLRKDWRFIASEAPTCHPKWEPSYPKAPQVEWRKRFTLGSRILREHNYYGLMEAEI